MSLWKTRITQHPAQNSNDRSIAIQKTKYTGKMIEYIIIERQLSDARMKKELCAHTHTQ